MVPLLKYPLIKSVGNDQSNYHWREVLETVLSHLKCEYCRTVEQASKSSIAVKQQQNRKTAPHRKK